MDPDKELSLLDLWKIVWGGRLTIIAITSVFAVASVAYSLTATEWYRADVLLIPNEDNFPPSLAGGFGQLGGLVGLSGLSASSVDSIESLAVLESRDLARTFIDKHKLVPMFFADRWDEQAGTWLDPDPEQHPDIRDAVEYFEDNVRNVSHDTRTQLVTLGMRWTDPETAAAWAADFVATLNAHMRERALLEAGKNVDYLRGELAATNVATLRDSIGVLLESELKKIMMARGNDEFAYKIVDSAQVPKYRDWPRRSLIVLGATFIGGVFALIVVFARYMLRSSPG